MVKSKFIQQFQVLMWKNFLLKLRQPFATIIEIAFPILSIIIIMLVRNLQYKDNIEQCFLKEKYMDSMGPLPLVRNFMCTFSSNCYNKSQISQNDSNQNDFIIFLNNITYVYNSIPKNVTTPALFYWFITHPKEVQILNYSITYLHNVSDPLIEALEMLSSENDTKVDEGINTLSTSVCGSSKNDVKAFLSLFYSKRSKRETQSCVSKLYQSLSRTWYGNQIFYSLAPILFGKIFYTPVSNFTQNLVKRANYSFVILDKLRLSTIDWRLGFRNWLERQLTNTSSIDELRNLSLQCIRDNVFQFVPYCVVMNNMLNKTYILSVIKSLSTVFLFLENLLNCTELNKFVPVQSVVDMDNFSPELMINIFAGLVLDPASEYMTSKNATFLNYTIRMPTNRIDSTTNFKVLDQFWSPAPRKETMQDLKYYTSGFLLIQEALDRAFTEIVTNNQTVHIGSSMQIMPSPCYVRDIFIQFSSNLLPFFFIVAWSPTFSILIKRIVLEKEMRLTEFMHVMGMTSSVHWLSWFVISLLTTVIPNIITTLILKYKQIFQFSSPAVVFILLFSYTVSFISQAFMISVFFNKANIAAVVAALLYFVFYVPFLVLIHVQDDVTSTIYFLSGVLSQVSFCNGLNFVAYWEQSMDGAQFHNLMQSTTLNLNFGVGHCILMLWVGAALYLLVALYVEAVFPGQYGIPRIWYFFLTKNYWSPDIDKCQRYVNGADEEGESMTDVESAPENLNIGISIQNLTKRFSKSGLPALQNLNLNFYQSHITAFLGHNGAGKTTTISILTGIYPPTSGTAYILNQDIRCDIESIRSSLGLCPQYNVLFDNLTVEDHLYFFGLLKGLIFKNIQLSLAQIVNDIGLTKKMKTQTKNLSGGMKRKLCVALAFLGNSKVIILDEPTAGVDPFARRGIWDLIIKYRSPENTIILTTHHMDEADYLSDRIAIISQGKLRCCGSSMFLKRHFGDGYHLVLVKSSIAQKEDFKDHSTCGKEVLKFVQTFVKNSEIVEETRTQLTLILPLTGLDGYGFHNLFKSLDHSLDKLNIACYGLSDTSLEDVFLKVANDPSSKNNNAIVSEHLTSIIDNVHYPVPEIEKENKDEVILISGFLLFLQQISALQIKKFHYTKRNVKGLFSEIIIPVLLVVMIVGILKMINPLSNQPPMTIHPWLMMPAARDMSLHTFYQKETGNDSMIVTLTDLYRTDLGESGTLCMNQSTNSFKSLVCSPNLRNTWSANPSDTIPQESPACDCSETGYQKCNNQSSGGPPNSYRIMASSDILHNLTGYNISDHLIKTFKTYTKNRYGGFQIILPSSFGLTCNVLGNSSLWNELRISISVSEPNVSNTRAQSFVNNFQQFFQLSGIRTHFVRIWVNNKGFVSMPAYANIFDNLVLRSHLDSSENPTKYGIVVTSYPFKYSKIDLLLMVSKQIFLEVSLANFVILALSLIPASFVIFLIEERVCGSKRQQFVSGVNPYVYWVSNLFWDISKYFASTSIIIGVFYAFNYQSYTGIKNLWAFVAILCAYGFAIIPHMYPFSFFIKTPSTAFAMLSVYNLFVGAITTMSTYFLEGMQDNNPFLVLISNGLKKIFLLFPQYCLGRGMVDISYSYLMYNISNGAKEYNPFDWDISGKKLTALGVMFVFWCIVILVIESGIISRIICGKIRNHRLKRKEMIVDEDVDVALEREQVRTDVNNNYIVKVIDLIKIYNAKLDVRCKGFGKKMTDPVYEDRRKLAVNNICFGVREGECFGLLGVNGAGKTTTFKMLTGEELVSKGEATINGKSIITDMVAAHKNMGFCAQVDALHALLTCEEELYFYCRIRGIEASAIAATVQSTLRSLSLDPHAKKTSKSLSGGNKRKLSTAISLIGSPSVVILDEPTSGMDAGARRFLWSRIQRLTNEKKAVILTSHNMAECDVLCHRVAIMVDGQFRCLGSVQELKSKFGGDYYVTVKMRPSCDDFAERKCVKDFVGTAFKLAVSLRHENAVTVQFQIDLASVKLYTIFDFFENLKTTSVILDYSVSQITLEEIFINFAKKQNVSTDSSIGHNCYDNHTFELSHNPVTSS